MRNNDTPRITHLGKEWVTSTGRTVRLRPIVPEDQPLTAAFLRNLSFGTKYFRFGRGDVEFTQQQLAVICNPDPENCRRIIALTSEPDGDIQIGSAAFVIRPDRENCDLTILIADGWQGTRVAHRLMSMLIETARTCALQAMYAQVLATNRRMLVFAQRHGFLLLKSESAGGVRVLCLSLRDTP